MRDEGRREGDALPPFLLPLPVPPPGRSGASSWEEDGRGAGRTGRSGEVGGAGGQGDPSFRYQMKAKAASAFVVSCELCER
eukprot:scaffold290098_cov29-Tisochrysis_lutea.AAC.2